MQSRILIWLTKTWHWPRALHVTELSKQLSIDHYPELFGPMRRLNYPPLTNQSPQCLADGTITLLGMILKLYRGLMAAHAVQLVTKYWLKDQSIERSGAEIMNTTFVRWDKTQSLERCENGVRRESPWHVVSSWYLHFQGRWCNVKNPFSTDITTKVMQLDNRKNSRCYHHTEIGVYRSSWQGSYELIEHYWMSVTDSLTSLILYIITQWEYSGFMDLEQIFRRLFGLLLYWHLNGTV